MKNVNFVPKDVQRILSSHKSIMNRKCSTKISQYSQENTCVRVSFLIKMQVFRPPALLERDSDTSVFCEHWEIFKNIYIYIKEHLRTAASESFTWLFTRTNNIGSEKDVFLKIKQNKKLSYMKKTCLFITFFIISFFSFSPLHVRRRLPYVIKDDTSESLKQLNQWAINLGPMEKLCYLFTFAHCHLYCSNKY